MVLPLLKDLLKSSSFHLAPIKRYLVQRQAIRVGSSSATDKLSTASKLKGVFKRYGYIAGCFHSAVYVSTLSLVYSCLHLNFDIQSLADQMPLLDSIPFDPSAGKFVAAYAITAATGPGRGVVTVLATPWIAERVRQRKKYDSKL
jgi:hypothetical protein